MFNCIALEAFTIPNQPKKICFPSSFFSLQSRIVHRPRADKRRRIDGKLRCRDKGARGEKPSSSNSNSTLCTVLRNLDDGGKEALAVCGSFAENWIYGKPYADGAFYSQSEHTLLCGGRDLRCHPSHGRGRKSGENGKFGNPAVIYIDVPPLGELLIPLEGSGSLRNMPLGKEIGTTIHDGLLVVR